jgi:hypothetical protein
MKNNIEHNLKLKKKGDRRKKGRHQEKENRLMKECLNMEAEKKFEQKC